ncbi:hypothetical protein [Pedobacter aquatilis]|uniref:hypothetical protein n=1 Tax=Pedobacter aquatilis TaxID=351343 RepID=UPI00293085FD|nr:hypothetical protein [Pedobacter aquatilis]
MQENFVIEEFGEILKKYMEEFSLEAVDIAYLGKSVKRTVTLILENKGSLKLETADAISRSFGLRYYEFGNPNYPIPSLRSLPERTRQRIAHRSKEGRAVEKTYSSRDINQQIENVLSKYKIGDEFLAEQVAIQISKKFGQTYSVSEIINRFNKSFKKYIKKTNRKDVSREGRGRKPEFYVLIKK